MESKVRKRATQKRVVYVIAALVALLAIFALLTRKNSSDGSADTTTVPPSSTVAPTSTAVATTAKLPAAISVKPVVIVPSGPAPTKLTSTDLVVGTGPEVTAGASVSVNYVGVSWSTKKEFDASWGRSPFEVENVGQASVIAGWNEGLIGMKEGGRRQLVIPPDKGYGKTGAGADIKPDETLVFVIDAIKVTPKA